MPYSSANDQALFRQEEKPEASHWLAFLGLCNSIRNEFVNILGLFESGRTFMHNVGHWYLSSFSPAGILLAFARTCISLKNYYSEKRPWKKKFLLKNVLSNIFFMTGITAGMLLSFYAILHGSTVIGLVLMLVGLVSTISDVIRQWHEKKQLEREYQWLANREKEDLNMACAIERRGKPDISNRKANMVKSSLGLASQALGAIAFLTGLCLIGVSPWLIAGFSLMGGLIGIGISLYNFLKKENAPQNPAVSVPEDQKADEIIQTRKNTREILEEMKFRKFKKPRELTCSISMTKSESEKKLDTSQDNYLTRKVKLKNEGFQYPVPPEDFRKLALRRFVTSRKYTLNTVKPVTPVERWRIRGELSRFFAERCQNPAASPVFPVQQRAVMPTDGTPNPKRQKRLPPSPEEPSQAKRTRSDSPDFLQKTACESSSDPLVTELFGHCRYAKIVKCP